MLTHTRAGGGGANAACLVTTLGSLRSTAHAPRHCYERGAWQAEGGYRHSRGDGAWRAEAPSSAADRGVGSRPEAKARRTDAGGLALLASRMLSMAARAAWSLMSSLPAARRGARAVGAARACGDTLGPARQTPPRERACARAAVPRGWGGGAAARTTEVQLGAAMADLLQRLSERHPNHFSRPVELARLTATLLCCSRALPAQRDREGALRQALHAEAGNLAIR